LDIRVGDTGVELRHPGNACAAARGQDISNSDVPASSAVDLLATALSIPDLQAAITHSILLGSTLPRLITSLKTADKRSSGRQSLKPPFLAYMSA
jgi:hypothetical protein